MMKFIITNLLKNIQSFVRYLSVNLSHDVSLAGEQSNKCQLWFYSSCICVDFYHLRLGSNLISIDLNCGSVLVFTMAEESKNE